MAYVARSKKRADLKTLPDVLTLAEAAEFLRLEPKKVQDLVAHGELPGRKVGDDYRFLRSALETWLEGTSSKRVLLGLAGALKGDPYFPQIIDEIYKARKQSARRRS